MSDKIISSIGLTWFVLIVLKILECLTCNWFVVLTFPVWITALSFVSLVILGIGCILFFSLLLLIMYILGIRED